jgi:hypothetical protein
MPGPGLSRARSLSSGNSMTREHTMIRRLFDFVGEMA